MNLPTVVKVIIYDYVANNTHICPKTNILYDDTNTSDDYLKILFGAEYEKFTYLNTMYENVYNNCVRYLRTKDCKEIKLCNNLTGLILKGNIEENLPESLTELRCDGIIKKIPSNLRVLVSSINDDLIAHLPDSVELIFTKTHTLPLTKLPKNLKMLYLMKYNHLLPYDIFENIPLKYLKFGDYGNPLFLESLSTTLEYLTLSDNYNWYINLNNFVLLKYLKFGNSFDQPVDLDKLVLLTYLSFGQSFDRTVQLDKLVSLRYLKFGHFFNKVVQLDKLVLLEKLILGNVFNQTIQLDKLVSLKYLKFGFNFNKAVQLNKLISLEKLIFGSNFNKPVQLNKLKSLKYLKFGSDFNQSLFNDIVVRFEKFNINVEHCHFIIKFIFTIARHMIFPIDFLYGILDGILICNSLIETEHVFSYSFCTTEGILTTVYIFFILLHNLLSICTIASMMIGYICFPKSIPNIYSHLLWYSVEFPHITKKTLFSMHTINLIFRFLSKKIINYISKKQTCLPPNVEKIIFGDNFNKPLFIGMFPKSVKKIIFGHNFNQPLAEDIITGKWAENWIGRLINSIFSTKFLPDNITYLEFGNQFNHRIYNYHLPKKIERIVVSSSYAYIEKLNELCNRKNIQLNIAEDY